MKKSLYIALLATIAVVGCKEKTQDAEAETSAAPTEEIAVNYQSFGQQIDDQEVSDKAAMLEQYMSMKEGDTIAMKFRSKVNTVCQMKGCWMRLDLGDEEVHVTFKDYGFFVPKDIADQEVIVEGIAYVEMTDVDTLKHFAEDAGKPQAEIDAITEPQLTYAFLSSGVLLPEKQ
ncbi:DUF4920 domain-containing protein [Aureitalea marina]|uniref:DUF4920 domain-containing protein n=1 Tax=Aureitalea marina TaxID=930804 RepID=A0A2S7KMK3_9FLAO|nr:DUF4920 domain-containing protein [Aureitalea marina]PQB03828.1 DUF4920 domain-containing protein [Aureitalea marina]